MINSLKAFIQVILPLLFVDALNAQLIDWVGTPSPRSEVYDFLSPNEYNPHDNAAVSKIQSGVLMSLGSERSFITAALSPKVSGLLVTDKNPSVIRFTRINSALIKAAKNRQEYLKLRYASGFESWQALGLDALDKIWWDLYVSQLSRHKSTPLDEGFEVLRSGIEAPHTKGDLTETYLSRDDLFQQIKKLADTDSIQGVLININNEEEVTRLFEELRKKKIKVSAADISNAHSQMYIKKDAMVHFLDELARHNPRALLTVTTSIRNLQNSWTYHSWRLSDVKKEGAIEFYLNTFQKPAEVIRPSLFGCRKALGD